MPTTATDMLLAQTDLEDLFARDPLDLSDREIDQLIEHYTARAQHWRQQQAKGDKQAKLPMIEGDAKTILAKLGFRADTETVKAKVSRS